MQHYLTHLSLDKMADILQMIFLDAFSLMKSFVFWLKFPKGPIDNNPVLV